MRKIQVPPNLTELAYRSIRESILSGEVTADDRLSEERFARELSISRSPIREALNRLAVEGLIEIIPRFGAHVIRYGPEEMVQLLELREALESLAMSSLRLSPKLIENLSEVVSRSKKHAAAGDVRNFILEDTRFHLLLARASGNRFLVKVFHNLMDFIELVRLKSMRRPGRLSLAQQHHENILVALKRGDANTAGELLRAHIDFLKEDLTTLELSKGPKARRIRRLGRATDVRE